MRIDIDPTAQDWPGGGHYDHDAVFAALANKALFFGVASREAWKHRPGQIILVAADLGDDPYETDLIEYELNSTNLTGLPWVPEIADEKIGRAVDAMAEAAGHVEDPLLLRASGKGLNPDRP